MKHVQKVEKTIDIHKFDDFAFVKACSGNHVDVVVWLRTLGDFRGLIEDALEIATVILTEEDEDEDKDKVKEQKFKIEVCGSFAVINGSVDLDKTKITNVRKRNEKGFLPLLKWPKTKLSFPFKDKLCIVI